ncbi:ribonuclease PH [Neomegalonema perideroedes]|uniref:ribonuclease PH n=1 Tax=Neomegalonema perideroedes TaxID=217219 RepID=UPI0003671F4E|nr:ribonuclease PH [Neomegalonema perideroedes]
MRPSGRALDQLRDVTLKPDVSLHAEGSCLVSFGRTQVLCTATFEERAPPWLKGSGKGWVTAEYGMLPRATNSRTRREAKHGGQTGRSQEIQRLIGRALRAGVDLHALGEKQIVVDCDVLQADGGTRTAAITGGFVALWRACAKLKKAGTLALWPIRTHVAAVSCGVYAGRTVLDLDYAEDSVAGADGNFVLTGEGALVEAQASAEGEAFSEEQFQEMLRLARKGIGELVDLQKQALGVS